MKKSHIIIILALAAVAVVAAVVLIVPQVFSAMKLQQNKQQWEQIMIEDSLSYLEQNAEDFNPKEWSFAGLRAEGKSEAAETHNAENPDDFRYPYLKTQISFREKSNPSSKARWVVYYEINEELDQIITGFEFVQDNG